MERDRVGVGGRGGAYWVMVWGVWGGRGRGLLGGGWGRGWGGRGEGLYWVVAVVAG